VRTDVVGDQGPPTAHAEAEADRLAAWGRAQIEYPFTRLRIQHHGRRQRYLLLNVHRADVELERVPRLVQTFDAQRPGVPVESTRGMPAPLEQAGKPGTGRIEAIEELPTQRVLPHDHRQGALAGVEERRPVANQVSIAVETRRQLTHGYGSIQATRPNRARDYGRPAR